MNTVNVISRPYRESDLQHWRDGRYGMLKGSDSYASPFIRDILIAKAKRRPGRRFFGEAFVAAHERQREGWYGSFKWLTSAKWADAMPLSDRFESEFQKALRDYFPELADFQKIANRFATYLNGKNRCRPTCG
jgi:hypothetical protein